MLLFFYPVLCKPCKWCAIKTIYKQKDVYTELFKADSFAGKYNITECSVCFSCCGVSELKYFWQITYQILQIIWRAQAIKEIFNYLICNFTKSSNSKGRTSKSYTLFWFKRFNLFHYFSFQKIKKINFTSWKHQRK